MTSDIAQNDSGPLASTVPAGSGPRGSGESRVRAVTPQAIIDEVLDPVVAAMGYELVHVEWVGSGKHRRLAVYLDKEGGISLDDCTKMSPIISNALDAAEGDPAVSRVLSAKYMLEVSSPGLDRPLSKLSHFRRYVGGTAKVSTFEPLPSNPSSRQKNFNGRIENVLPDPGAPQDDRAGTIVLVDSDDEARYTIGLDQIRRANLVFEE